ncbi:MAG: VOC family protein [Sediminibacterium sp.]
MQIECIHHIAILTSTDLYEASKTFYTEVLGFTLLAETYRAERNSYKLDLALNGVYQIELFSFPDHKERASFPESKGLRHLAFAVKDVVSSRNWLLEKGVRTEELRVDSLTNKEFVFFYDPNGQPLELYQL